MHQDHLDRLTRWVTQSHRQPPFATPQGFESVGFKSADGTELSGWLSTGTRGAVVLCHGINSDRRWMLPKARLLAARGFATLLFDFRARGNSAGECCSLGQRETEDVRAAVDLLAERFPGKPIGGLGESLGAAALLLAMHGDPRLRCAVSEACFTSMRAAIRRRMPWGSTWLEQRLRRAGVDVGVVDPLAVVGCLRRPLLLIHDRWDIGCTRAMSNAMLRAAGPQASLWVAPRSLHVAAAWMDRREYTRRVIEFFEREFISR